jgi:hypothetical protein
MNTARFLWVAFQIDDICSWYSDEEIHQALQNFPKDLTETFNRALLRVLAKGNGKIAEKVFRWVAAAKRPLFLQELREAIAIEPGQLYSKPERLINDMNRVTAWCENLVIVDEEDDVVQFAHHTIKKHFLGIYSDQKVKEFHFQLQDANDELGEICVTYLNFNDFKTQLIRRSKPQPPITPSAIVETALANRSKLGNAVSLVQSAVAGRSRKKEKFDLLQKLASYEGGSDGDWLEQCQPGHPFLDYASKYWLLHTTNFDNIKSKT